MGNEANRVVRAVKGMNDIRPWAKDSFLDTAIWEQIFGVASEVLGSCGYHRVWLPVVEETALFARGIGEDSDIVSKEMYSFEDRGGRRLTLRPEGTASAVRAYLQHNLPATDPVQRWWYAGPMYRAERPQKGRYRQFYQVGAEFFGVAAPAADAEMLIVLARLTRELGLEDICIRINTLGDEASRVEYRRRLTAFLKDNESQLSEHAMSLIDRNPLRVLDSKRPEDRKVVADAPDIYEALTDDSKSHFETVQELLSGAGVEFSRDRKLVRGLDYYTGTIFEFTTGALGAQDAILGGGRYDNLVEELGGVSTPAIGFAAGVERLALLLAGDDIRARGPHLYLIPMQGCEGKCLNLAEEIRVHGALTVEVDVSGGRMKHQMRRADKLGAVSAVVVGEDELVSGKVRLKDMRASREVEVGLDPSAIAAAVKTMADLIA